MESNIKPEDRLPKFSHLDVKYGALKIILEVKPHISIQPECS